MDRLSLIGLETQIRVGCTQEERASPQRIEIDVDLFFPLNRAAQEDTVDATVDYAAVASRIKGEIEPREFRLIESIAERTAATILREFSVGRTIVRVRKRAFPGIAWAEVSIDRSALPSEKHRPHRKM